MNPYSTHMPILESFVDSFKPRTIFEFGCGQYSTPLFIEKVSDSVLSIEMQNIGWFMDIHDKYQSNKFSLYCMLGSTAACEYMTMQKRIFDMIFVDGHADRWLQVNCSFDKSSTIIAHDTNQNEYKWNQIKLPEGWKWMDIIENDPWTSVITNNTAVLEWCKKFSYKIHMD